MGTKVDLLFGQIVVLMNLFSESVDRHWIFSESNRLSLILICFFLSLTFKAEIRSKDWKRHRFLMVGPFLVSSRDLGMRTMVVPGIPTQTPSTRERQIRLIRFLGS